MKLLSKIFLISVSAVFLVFLFTPASFAYNIDGSVNDWGIDLTTTAASVQGYLNTNLPTGAYVDSETEDNADGSSGSAPVGPGNTVGNSYDVEAIYFDNDALYGYIAIITGFPSSGLQDPNDSSLWWDPGDIAIDVGNGWKYGIDVTDGILKNNTSWSNVYYPTHGNAGADPFTISSSDDEFSSGDFVYSSSAINDHYVIEASFLLSNLGLTVGVGDESDVKIHWTMGCGNDYLDLEATADNPIPEPATLFLFGSGLIGLAGFGRKKFFKSK